MRKIIIIALPCILLLMVIAAGCRPAAGPATKAASEERRTVRLVAVELGRLPRTVTVNGTLAADEKMVTGFKVAGRISEIVVDLGSIVRKNQLLARLDPTDFLHRAEQAEAALRQARARLGLSPEGTDDRVDPERTALVREARAVLDEARLYRDRMAKLVEKDFIPRIDFDAAVSRLLVAESRYQASIEEVRDRQALLAQRKSERALARQQLSDTALYAPMDGAVSERKASPGEFLAAGAPVVGLVRTHPLRLKVSVPEREAAAIRAGQEVRVRVEGGGGEQAGRVVRLSPIIEEQNRTLTVEITVENRLGRFKPGSFAQAEILVDTAHHVVLAPASAVVTFAGIEKVIGVKDGRAVERRIRTGRRIGNRVEVLEGLAAGDLIVAEPGNLSGGQPVVVAQQEARAEAR
ncbi:MAG: efflux RND transporter periplasmic adaptor subunit [Alphaproteobacteria bacterium]|uniref:Efflux RND transporter periplasmic adaptor subunit n=1 Tax=Candidatus Nitrobium versatile TaxID=2884831 RepID=A0A953J7H6_9BACT|nr:efflux RND transporter periplasmic adaptor subunit [Candidatus Nitrobium versatile]